MTDVDVRELEPGVFLIDHHFQGQRGVIASYLLADEGELALIESGPETTLETLLNGVRKTGHDPERITQILVTHIHLDHAGGCGALLRRLPRAKVLVHPVGAPHIIDPERLLSSAGRIYGDMMKPLWGEVLPVPEDRVHVLQDGQTFRAGGRVLRAIDTPGHAYHHFAFHQPETGTLYTGDVGGVRIDGGRYVRPPTPPPELDLPAWVASVTKLRTLRPARLRLTHFGEFTDADAHLDDLLARLFHWAGWVEARLADGQEPERITAELRDRGDAEISTHVGDEELIQAYELATNYRMTVDGYVRYFRKRKG